MRLSTFIFSALALYIQEYADKYEAEDLSRTLFQLAPDLSLPRIQSFDFIIVGGGTAGCVLAARLSERFTVLVLEQGGDPVPSTYNAYREIELGGTYHPAINNIFNLTPLENANRENGGVAITSTGRMLGGSGSHNDNGYFRGSPYDWDDFAAMVQDESWGYWGMLPHFKRNENFVGYLVNENEREEWYGHHGPITVTSLTPPLLPYWFHAGTELGYKVGDPNAFQKEAFTTYSKSIHDGEKYSSYTGFIRPIENTRKTLTIHRYSEVDQILLKDKIAYGVTYLRHGIPQIAHASKEVIISAGVFSSPILLMKSGIGPKNVLAQAKIPLQQDLPGVGRNLRTHILIPLNFTVPHPDPRIFPSLPEAELEVELGKFQETPRRGFFANLGNMQELQANIVSSRAKRANESYWPDLLIVPLIQHVYGREEPQIIYTRSVLTRTTSVGTLTLNTTAFLGGARGITELAIIDTNVLSEQGDVEALVEAVKITLRIFEGTSTFRGMGVKRDFVGPRRCAGIPQQLDDYWRCFVRERATLWEVFAGTCKMGRREDPLSVVDSKLRVKGIERLRVVDQSIMPRPMNTEPHAGILGIAEKTASHLLSTY